MADELTPELREHCRSLLVEALCETAADALEWQCFQAAEEAPARYLATVRTQREALKELVRKGELRLWPLLSAPRAPALDSNGPSPVPRLHRAHAKAELEAALRGGAGPLAHVLELRVLRESEAEPAAYLARLNSLREPEALRAAVAEAGDVQVAHVAASVESPIALLDSIPSATLVASAAIASAGIAESPPRARRAHQAAFECKSTRVLLPLSSSFSAASPPAPHAFSPSSSSSSSSSLPSRAPLSPSSPPKRGGKLALWLAHKRGGSSALTGGSEAISEREEEEGGEDEEDEGEDEDESDEEESGDERSEALPVADSLSALRDEGGRGRALAAATRRARRRAATASPSDEEEQEQEEAAGERGKAISPRRAAKRQRIAARGATRGREKGEAEGEEESEEEGEEQELPGAALDTATPRNWARMCREPVDPAADARECAALARATAAYKSVSAARKRERDALLRAAQAGRAATVEALLRRGLPLDGLGRRMISKTQLTFETPLFCAAWHGRPRLVRALLERGALVDARSEGEWTPLMAAASGNFVRCAHELVMAGARLNAVNEDGETAMILAAFTDAAPVVALLLQCGAATHVANKHGQTALSVACEFNAYDSAVLLLDALPAHQSEAAQSARAMALDRALVAACRTGRQRVARLLLERGASPAAADSQGRDLVSMCVAEGFGALAIDLLHRGARPPRFLASGETPLTHVLKSRAAKHDGLERLLDALLDAFGEDADALVDAVDKSGESPLHVAARIDAAGAASLLLKRGAAVDARNSSGESPLLIAARQIRGKQFVRVLLDGGADPCASDTAGVTPLAASASAEVTALLRDAVRIEHGTALAWLLSSFAPSHELREPLRLTLGFEGLLPMLGRDAAGAGRARRRARHARA